MCVWMSPGRVILLTGFDTKRKVKVGRSILNIDTIHQFIDKLDDNQVRLLATVKTYFMMSLSF